MQLYGRGIRRRLAPMLDGDRRRLELAYSLMLTLPGTPVLRYGDEIGMGDDLILPERNCARTPMQWTSEPHGRLHRRRQARGAADRRRAVRLRHVNVADQRRDPNSMLNWTERVVRMRKEVPEIGWGDFSLAAGRSGACWRSATTGATTLRLHPQPRRRCRARSRSCRSPRGTEPKLLVNLLSDDHSHRRRRAVSTVSFWSLTATAGSASAA